MQQRVVFLKKEETHTARTKKVKLRQPETQRQERAEREKRGERTTTRGGEEG